MFSQTDFSAPLSVLIALMEYAFVVWLPDAQEMEHNASELVSGCGNRLRFAEPSANAPEEFTEIVVRVVQGIGPHA